LPGYQSIERFALFLIEDRKRQTKTGELLIEPDFASQWQPTTLRQVNQKADDFTYVCRPSGVDETSVRAQVLKPAFVAARKAVPLNRKINGNAFTCSSLFSHCS
jgi:hypothetical protein